MRNSSRLLAGALGLAFVLCGSSALAQTIASITPATGSTAGGYPLTIAGTGFGATAGTVALNGVPCTVATWSDTSITCIAPEGEGAMLRLSVVPAGGGSVAGDWSYDPPAIALVSPGTVPTAGGGTITLTGSNFGRSGTITVGGSPCPMLSWSHNTARCTVPAGQGTGVSVQLTTGMQSDDSTLDYEAPVVTSITPTMGPAAGGNTLLLQGSNFGTSGTITIGIGLCTQTAYSHTQAQCTVPAGTAGSSVVVMLTSAGRSASPPTRYTYVAGGSEPSPDAAAEAGVDASSEAGAEAGADAAAEAGAEAGTDAALDSAVAPDAGAEAATSDAAMDSSAADVRPAGDGGSGDASLPSGSLSGGCGCAVPGSAPARSSSTAALGVLLGALVARARSRRAAR